MNRGFEILMGVTLILSLLIVVFYAMHNSLLRNEEVEEEPKWGKIKLLDPNVHRIIVGKSHQNNCYYDGCNYHCGGSSTLLYCEDALLRGNE